MLVLYILVAGALAFQIALFFIIKKKKNGIKEKNSILDKYKIRNRSDAFRALSNADLPESDKIEIEKFYQTY